MWGSEMRMLVACRWSVDRSVGWSVARWSKAWPPLMGKLDATVVTASNIKRTRPILRRFILRPVQRHLLCVPCPPYTVRPKYRYACITPLTEFEKHEIVIRFSPLSYEQKPIGRKKLHTYMYRSITHSTCTYVHVYTPTHTHVGGHALTYVLHVFRRFVNQPYTTNEMYSCPRM